MSERDGESLTNFTLFFSAQFFLVPPKPQRLVVRLRRVSYFYLLWTCMLFLSWSLKKWNIYMRYISRYTNLKRIGYTIFRWKLWQRSWFDVRRWAAAASLAISTWKDLSRLCLSLCAIHLIQLNRLWIFAFYFPYLWFSTLMSNLFIRTDDEPRLGLNPMKFPRILEVSSKFPHKRHSIECEAENRFLLNLIHIYFSHFQLR